jgi:hypothetical protein
MTPAAWPRGGGQETVGAGSATKPSPGRRQHDGPTAVADHVVPFASVQAIVERLRAPLEVMTFPVSHDAGPAMRARDRFDERWLGLAVRGVPSGFGQHDPRRQHSAAASRTQAR